MDGVRTTAWTLILWAISGWTSATADSTTAYCEIHPRVDRPADASGPCTFSQRQGWVSIRLADGSVHELEPVGGDAGRYRDEQGRAVLRQDGLGDQGLVFRFAERSIHVYWHAASRSKRVNLASVPRAYCAWLASRPRS